MTRSRLRVGALAAALVLALAGVAASQPRGAPTPLAYPPATETPRDIPYPGVLTLSVDATDLNRKIFWAHETIPVEKAGPMTLLYAQWLPGNHSPSGPLRFFAGLKITANGKPVAWTRDPVDVFAFHVDVPSGARQLDIEAEYLTPVESGEGGTIITDEMMRLQWYATALYPAGHFSRQIQIAPRVKLPEGWDYAVALESRRTEDGYVVFDPVSFETLADSPLIAGKYSRKIDLDPGGRSRVTLNIFADAPEYLETTDEVVQIHRNLVVQADRLFGARHYDHYDFLFSLSDNLAGAGLEHARSTEVGTGANYFKTWDSAALSRDLLAHEYTHSWNGKYRRPADLWTPTFNVPMRNSGLWVYEGQTQYWGDVLAARAGFLSRQQALDVFANTAAAYQMRIGRQWRPLMDTTNDPIIAARRNIPWTSWQRSEDYYNEGLLIWLDVDTLIRERSGGKRSLNDFAKAFFGVNDGDWGQMTYTFDDVVSALNKVEPYDWASFLHARLDAAPTEAPLDGLRRGGYELVYTDEPNDYWKAGETRSKSVNLSYAIGASFTSSGRITGVVWDSPAFNAGLTEGVQIIAVNDETFTAERIKAAVKATRDGQPVKLMFKRGERYSTVTLDYDGGLRYPHLQRIEGTPARLDAIFAPL